MFDVREIVTKQEFLETFGTDCWGNGIYMDFQNEDTDTSWQGDTPYFDDKELMRFEIQAKVEYLDAELQRLTTPSLRFVHSIDGMPREEYDRIMADHHRKYGRRIKELTAEIQFLLNELDYIKDE